MPAAGEAWFRRPRATAGHHWRGLVRQKHAGQVSQASGLLGDRGKCERPHAQQRRGRVPTRPVFPRSPYPHPDISRRDGSMQRAEKERGHPSFLSELRENRKALATFLDHFVWICFSTQWACGSITVTVTLTAREGSWGKEAGTVGPAWADDGLDSNYFPAGTHVTEATSQERPGVGHNGGCLL